MIMPHFTHFQNTVEELRLDLIAMIEWLLNSGIRAKFKIEKKINYLSLDLTQDQFTN